MTAPLAAIAAGSLTALDALTYLAGGAAIVFALVLAYTYAGYPLLSQLLAKLFPNPAKRAPIEPTVTLIIAAYNEEDAIADKLENSLQLDYPAEKLQIIVASDGSTDATHDIVRSYADRGVQLFVPPGHRGKTGTANECVPTTTSEILVFSDATGVYDPQVIRALVANFADPSVGAVSGRVVYSYDKGVAAQGFAAYQSFVVAHRHAEGRFGTETSVSGAIHAVRRELYKPAPADLSFDMVHPLHMAQLGKRTVYEFDAVCIEEARSRAEDEYSSRVRIGIRAYSYIPYLLHGLRTCNDPLFTFQVVSHKLLRWLSPLLLFGFIACSAVLALRGGWFAAPFAASVAGIVVAAIGWVCGRLGVNVPGMGVPLFFATINLGFLVGFVRYTNGGRVAGWAPDRGEGEVTTLE